MRARPYLKSTFEGRILYDETSKSCLRWANGKEIEGVGADGYYRFQLDRLAWKAHRVVYCLAHGDILDGSLHIDHIDRDRLNNKLSNLRLGSCSQNCLNKRKKISKYARARRGRWESYFAIPRKGKFVNCGTFGTELEAHRTAVARRLELYWNP